MLIIIAFAIYRTKASIRKPNESPVHKLRRLASRTLHKNSMELNHRTKASIRKPNERPVYKDTMELNPAHPSFDQDKLFTSFLHKETGLDQETDLDQKPEQGSDTDATLSSYTM